MKLLYQLITKPHSWDIIRYERKVDLKKLCACLFNITGEEETEFAAEEDREQMTKIKTKCLVNILCNNEPLESIDILLEDCKSFQTFFNSVARFTTEKGLISLFSDLLQNRKSLQLMKISLEETFEYVFYSNNAPMIEGYVHFFEIFNQSVIHSPNEVLLKYFLNHSFDFLHGLTSNNIKVKESCWVAILCIYKLDDKRKSELLEMSGCKITPPQSTIQELLELKKKPDIDILKEYQFLITDQCKGRSLHQVKENMISDEIKKLQEYIDCIQKGKSLPNTVTAYPDELKLIRTQTTTKTLSRILEVIDNPVNLLLEGSTGIGKTAIVTEAAKILEKRLLRFNLSSSTSISNLFGSAFPSEKNDRIEINFHKGDFTTAYSEGYWLLLDEFNLAPDNVLSCIKDALDNGVLIIPTDSAETGKSGEDQKYIQYEKHENFRLFCTQNPSSGFYKGKREEHSGSMLSRFCPIVVPNPNIEELRTIVHGMFLKAGIENSESSNFAYMMTKIHEKIEDYFKEAKEEKQVPYNEITLRDLIRWVERALADGANGTEEQLSNIARSIYVSRLRTKSNQVAVKKIIKKECKHGMIEYFNTEKKISLRKQKDEFLTSYYIDIGKRSEKVFEEKMEPITVSSAELYKEIALPFLREKLQKDQLVSLGHNFIEKIEVILKEGFPNCLNDLFNEFCSLSRSKEEQKHLAKKLRELLGKYNHSFSVSSFLEKDIVGKKFIAITKEFKSCWSNMVDALKCRQPILITGEAGCGKSEMVNSLGILLNKPMVHLYVTPDTEPEALVGYLMPKEKCINWNDGIVTKAAKEGKWLIIENLSQAQSTVLERLNPILECPPVWRISERGEGEKQSIDIHEDFRIIAIMTPPTGKRGSERLRGANVTTNSELSPALYNRFSIINIDTLINQTSLEMVFDANLQFSTLQEESSRITDMFLQLKEKCSSLNLLHFNCLLNTTYSLRLQNKHQNLENLSEFYSAIELHLLSNIKDETVKQEMRHFIATTTYKDFANCEDWTSEGFQNVPFKKDDQYLLDKKISLSRYKLACIISTAIKCNFPCLLEGPAATGKSSLIKHMAECNKKHLEQVNNTESTSVNDYVGSIMPNGKFAPGPLVRAMRNGSYFLADEINLAEPSVLSVLNPLLDGKDNLLIPNTNILERAHPDFRIFATQNGITYTGRKELPQSLRSRFTEVCFSPFTKDEILGIIEKRGKHMMGESFGTVKNEAKKLAKFYEIMQSPEGRSLFQKDVTITVREVIKWIRRKSIFPKANFGKIGFELLYTKVKDPDKLSKILKGIFKELTDVNLKPDIDIDVEGKTLLNKNNEGIKIPPFKESDPKFWTELKNSSSKLPTFKEHLWNISVAAACHEPILLIGPTSFKSHLISTWCKMNQRNDIDLVLCNDDTESADLLGRLRPYSDNECLSLLVSLSKQFYLKLNEITEDITTISYKKQNENFENDYTSTMKDIEKTLFQMNSLKNNSNKKKANVKEGLVEEKEKSGLKTKQVTVKEKQFHEGNRLKNQDETVDCLPKKSNSMFGADDETNNSEDSEDDSSTEEEDSCDGTDSDKSDAVGDSDSDFSEEDRSSVPTDIVLDKVAPVPVDHKKISNSMPEELESFSMSNLYLNSYATCYKAFQLQLENFKEHLKIITSNIRRPEKTYGLELLLKKYDLVMKEVLTIILSKGSINVVFIFQDGPCSKAVKEGSVMILKDINFPSQAVTERLNTLFDIEPTFALNEDLILSESYHVQYSMTLFATVTLKSRMRTDKLNISPALQSRMTVIEVPSYKTSELIEMTGFSQYSNDREFGKKFLETVKVLQGFVKINSRSFFQLKHFVEKQLEKRDKSDNSIFITFFLTGIIYLWADQIPKRYEEESHPYKRIMEIFGFSTVKSFGSDKDTISHDESVNSFGEHYNDEIITMIEGKEIDTSDSHCDIFELRQFDSKRSISLKGTPLVCELAESAEKLEPLRDIVISQSTYRNICRVFAAAECQFKLLLNGPPGVGKTKIIEELARVLGFKCIRINFSANTTIEDLIGSFIPRVIDGKQTFTFSKGPLVQALQDPFSPWILLDEINLAHPTVLQRLIPIFASHNQLRIEATGEVINLERIHLFATKNPESIGGGRNRLPDAVESCFTTVYLTELTNPEFLFIGNSKLETQLVNEDHMDSKYVLPILSFQSALENLIKSKRIGTKKDCVNLRDLEKMIKVIKTTSESHRLCGGIVDDSKEIKSNQQTNSDLTIGAIRTCADLIYSKRFANEKDKDEVRLLIDKCFPLKNKSNVINDIESDFEEYVRIGFVSIKKGTHLSTKLAPFYKTKEITEDLIAVAAAVQTKSTILIQGGNSAGKTSLILNLASICQRKIVNFQMTKDTTTSDLLGSWTANNSDIIKHRLECILKELFKGLVKFVVDRCTKLPIFDTLSQYYQENRSFFKNDKDLNKALDAFKVVFNKVEKDIEEDFKNEAEFQDIQSKYTQMTAYKEQLESSDINFVFIEGPLVEAMRNGHWFLIDNVGQAPGDVMERLNSLSETDQKLSLYEGSNNEVLSRKDNSIHKDFQLFVTYNTETKGSQPLSPAFKNRCITLNLSQIDEDRPPRSKAHAILEQDLLEFNCPRYITEILLGIHFDTVKCLKKKKIQTVQGYAFSIRNLLNASKMLMSKLNSDENTNPIQALTHAMQRSYCDPLSDEKHSLNVVSAYKGLLDEKKPLLHFEHADISLEDTTTTTETLTLAIGEFIYGGIEFIRQAFASIDQESYQNCPKIIKSEFVENLEALIGEIPNQMAIKRSLMKFIETRKNIFQIKNEGFLENHLKSLSSEIFTLLYQYAIKTSFMDIDRRCQMLKSGIDYVKCLIKLFNSFESILHKCRCDRKYPKWCVELRNCSLEISLRSSFVYYLKGLKNCNNKALLDMMVNMSMVENEKVKAKDSQKLIFNINALEAVYRLPATKSTKERQTSIISILNEMPFLNEDELIVNQLIRAEILTLHFLFVSRLPEFFMLETRIDLTEFGSLNYLFIMKKLLDIIDRYKSKKDSILEKFKNLFMNKNYPILSECRKMTEGLSELTRIDLINNWTKKYNQHQVLDFYEDSILDENVNLDVVCFFKIILERLCQEDGRRFNLVISNDIDYQQIMDDYEHHNHLIISPDMTEIIIIDFQNQKQKQVDIFCTWQNDHPMYRKLKETFCKADILVKEYVCQIKTPEAYKETFYVPSCILQIWINEKIQKTIPINVKIEEIEILEKETKLFLTKMKALVNGSYRDTSSFYSISKRFKDIIFLLEQLSDKSNQTCQTDLIQLNKKINDVHLVITEEYKAKKSKHEPKSLIEKVQLKYFLNAGNSFEENAVLLDLERSCSSPEVDKFIEIHEFLKTCQSSINQLYNYALSEKEISKRISFINSATSQLSRPLVDITSNIKYEDGKIYFQEDFYAKLKDFATQFNDFLDKNLTRGTYEKLIFNIHTTIIAKTKQSIQTEEEHVLEMQDNLEHEKKSLIEKLEDLSQQALKSGFSEFLPRIVNLVSDLHSVNTSNQTDVIINIKMAIKSIEENIALCYAAVERDKRLEFLSIGGIEEPTAPLDIAIPPLDHKHSDDCVDVDIDLNHLIPYFFGDTDSKVDSYQEILDIDEFAKQLNCLSKSQNCQIAITSLQNIENMLNYKIGDETKIDMLEELKVLETVVDSPECFLSISKMKDDIKEDKINEIHKQLEKLLQRILDEKILAISQLKSFTLYDVTNFLDLTSNETSIQLGNFSQRFKDVQRARQIINQQINLSLRNGRFRIKMEYLSLLDFASSFTYSLDMPILLKKNSPDNLVKSFQNHMQNNIDEIIMTDETITQLANSLSETSSILRNISHNNKNSESTAPYNFLSNYRNLETLSDVWSNAIKNFGNNDTLLVSVLEKEQIVSSVKLEGKRNQLKNYKTDYKHEQELFKDRKKKYGKDRNRLTEKARKVTFNEKIHLKEQTEILDKEYKNEESLVDGRLEELSSKIKEIEEEMQKNEESIKKKSKDQVAEIKRHLIELLKKIQSCYGEIINLVQKGNEDNKKTIKQLYDQVITDMNSDCDNKHVFLEKEKKMLCIMDKLERCYVDEISKISSFLQSSSKLYQNLIKVYDLGKCLIYSLYRSYRQIHTHTMKTSNEKQNSKRLKELKQKMEDYLLCLKDEGTVDTAESYKKSLLEFYKILKELREENSSTMFKMDLDHTITYLQQYVVAFLDIISGSEDTADMSFLNSFDVYKGLCFGERAQLRKDLPMRKECTNTLGDGITLFALLDYSKKFELMDDESKDNDETLKCLLNISNFIDCFKEHLKRMAQILSKQRTLKEERDLLKELFQVTKEVSLIECSTEKLLVIESFESKCVFQLVEYGIAVRKETYGAITIQKKLEDLIDVMKISRKDIEKKMEVQRKIASKISFYFSKAILHYKGDIAVAHITDEINKKETAKATNEQFSETSLKLNFLKSAVKQLAVKAVNLYDDHTVYPDCTQKFENIVLMSLTLNDESMTAKEALKRFDLSFFSNRRFLENILRGKVARLQALFKDQNHNGLVEQFKEKIDRWQILADSLKEQQHILLKTYLPEEMKIVDQTNERNKKEFESDMEVFEQKKKHFEEIAKEIFGYILQTYRYQTGEDVICSQYVTIMERFDSILRFDWFKRSDFDIKYKIFVRLKSLSMCSEHLYYHSKYLKCLIYCNKRQKDYEMNIPLPARNMLNNFLGTTYKVKINHSPIPIIIDGTCKKVNIKIINLHNRAVLEFQIDVDSIEENNHSETKENLYSSLELSHRREVIAAVRTKSINRFRIDKPETDVDTLRERCYTLLDKLPKDLKPPDKRKDIKPKVLQGQEHDSDENPILSTMKEFYKFLENDRTACESEVKDLDLEKIEGLETIHGMIQEKMEKMKENGGILHNYHHLFLNYIHNSFEEKMEINQCQDFLHGYIYVINQTWKPLNKVWLAEQKEVFSKFYNLFNWFKYNYENKSLIILVIQQMCSLIQSLSLSNSMEISSYTKLVKSIQDNVEPNETIAKTKKFLHRTKTEFEDFRGSIQKLKPLHLEEVTSFNSGKLKQENATQVVKLSRALGKDFEVNLDLGFSLEGIPQRLTSPPYITFENCEKENLAFEFSLPLFCKISKAFGKIKANKQITIYFEPMNDFEKEENWIKKEFIDLSISFDTFILPIKVVLNRQIEKIKLDQIFIESQSRNDTSPREIDFGDVMAGQQASKAINIRNPFPVHLRMKLETFSNEIFFDKNDLDVVLNPSQEKSIICTIRACHSTQEAIKVNTTVHFSGHLQFPLAVCYFPKIVDVQINYKSQTIRYNSFKKTLHIAPSNIPTSFDDINIINTGETSLILKISISFNYGEKKTVLQNLSLAVGDSHIPSVQLISRKEGHEDLNINLVVTDNYDNLVKEFNFHIKVKYAWPKIKLNSLHFEVHKLGEIQLNYPILSCVDGEPQISSIKVDGIKLKEKCDFSDGSSNKIITFRFTPDRDSKCLIAKMETNCYIPTQYFKIKLNIPEITAQPAVISLFSSENKGRGSTVTFHSNVLYPCHLICNFFVFTKNKSWDKSQKHVTPRSGYMIVRDKTEQVLNLENKFGYLKFRSENHVLSDILIPVLPRQSTDPKRENSICHSQKKVVLEEYKSIIKSVTRQDKLYIESYIIPFIEALAKGNMFNCDILTAAIQQHSTPLIKEFDESLFGVKGSKHKKTENLPLKYLLMFESMFGKKTTHVDLMMTLCNHFFIPSMDPIKTFQTFSKFDRSDEKQQLKFIKNSILQSVNPYSSAAKLTAELLEVFINLDKNPDQHSSEISQLVSLLNSVERFEIGFDASPPGDIGFLFKTGVAHKSVINVEDTISQQVLDKIESFSKKADVNLIHVSEFLLKSYGNNEAKNTFKTCLGNLKEIFPHQPFQHQHFPKILELTSELFGKDFKFVHWMYERLLLFLQNTESVDTLGLIKLACETIRLPKELSEALENEYLNIKTQELLKNNGDEEHVDIDEGGIEQDKLNHVTENVIKFLSSAEDHLLDDASSISALIGIDREMTMRYKGLEIQDLVDKINHQKHLLNNFIKEISSTNGIVLEIEKILSGFKNKEDLLNCAQKIHNLITVEKEEDSYSVFQIASLTYAIFKEKEAATDRSIPEEKIRVIRTVLSKVSSSSMLVYRWYFQLLPIVYHELKIDQDVSKKVVVMIFIIDDFLEKRSNIHSDFISEHIFDTISLIISKYKFESNKSSKLEVIQRCSNKANARSLEIGDLHEIIAKLADNEKLRAIGKLYIILEDFRRTRLEKPFFATKLVFDTTQKILAVAEPGTLFLKEKLLLAEYTFCLENKGNMDELDIIYHLKSKDSLEGNDLDVYIMIEYLWLLQNHNLENKDELPFFMPLLKNLKKSREIHYAAIEFVAKVCNGSLDGVTIPSTEFLASFPDRNKRLFSFIAITIDASKLLTSLDENEKRVVKKRIMSQIKAINMNGDEESKMCFNNSASTLEQDVYQCRSSPIHYLVNYLAENKMELQDMPISKSGFIAVLKLYEIFNHRHGNLDMLQVSELLFKIHEGFSQNDTNLKLIENLYIGIGALAKPKNFIIEVLSAILLTITFNVLDNIPLIKPPQDLSLEDNLHWISNLDFQNLVEELNMETANCHKEQNKEETFFNKIDFAASETPFLSHMFSKRLLKEEKGGQNDDDDGDNDKEYDISKEDLKFSLDEDLKPLEQEIQSIEKTISFKKTKDASTEFLLNINIEKTIIFLHKAFEVNEEMKQLIQSQVTDNAARKLLPKNTANRILIQLHNLYSISKILSISWSRQFFKGHFEESFQIIKDQMKNNMMKVIRTLVDKDQQNIIRCMKDSGINLNPNNSVYNFDIPLKSNTEIARSRIEEHHRSRDYNTTITGRFSTSIFKDNLSFSLNTGLGSNWIDSQKKEKIDYDADDKLVEEILHIKVPNSFGLDIKSGQFSLPKKPQTSTKQLKTLNGDFKVVSACSKAAADYKQNLVEGFYNLTSDQRKMVKDQSRQRWVTKMREIKKVHQVAAFESPEKLPEHPEEDLRYLLLARLTRDYQSMCVQIMTLIERKDDKGQVIKRLEPEQSQVYKFLFLVDNSGSMNGEKMTLSMNILVIFLEAMKRLEFQTAVVRYGGEKSQVTLKRFSHNMDEHRGQLILDSFDASEKTRTADALRYVAEKKKLFKIQKDANEHRFIILISDGIWDQRERDLYNRYLNKAAARLLVITTHPRQDKALQREHQISVDYATNLLNSIAQDAWYGVSDKSTLEEQIRHIAVMIDNQLRDSIKRVVERSGEEVAMKSNGITVRTVFIFSL